MKPGAEPKGRWPASPGPAGSSGPAASAREPGRAAVRSAAEAPAAVVVDAAVNVPVDTAVDAAVLDQATRWLVRLWSGNASEADRAGCARWRADHPDHERVFSRLLAFEEKLQAVPPGAVSQALQSPDAVPLRRRRALRTAGLLLVTGGAALVAARHVDGWDRLVADYATALGETRTIDLADGTRVTLAPLTAIDVRYDEGLRAIRLRAGEVMVESARDPAPRPRPLRVVSRNGSVEAIGTRFLVRQEAGQSRVNVLDGAVLVRTDEASRSAVRVASGQATTFSSDGVAAPKAASDAAAAWTRGQLVAQAMPVDDFLAELGRFRRGWLTCDPQAGPLRVTGVFSLRDTDRALHNLALALPVEIVQRTRFWTVVRSR